MATPQQAIIMAGFDYQGGGIDFLDIARTRQKRLLTKNPNLTTTIMDVGSGMTIERRVVPGKAKPTILSTSTHRPVTAKNYSKGLGEHTRFDRNRAGCMSITDLYSAVKAIGQNKAMMGGLIEVSVFSHAFVDGPILVNSNDGMKAQAARDADDKDARANKDFTAPNMGIGDIAAFRAAFAPGAIWWDWGCQFPSSFRQVTDRVVHSPIYLRTPRGKMKDTDKIKFTFPRAMADEFFDRDPIFFPQAKDASGKHFKTLSFERTFKEIREFFLRGVHNSYHGRVGKAGQLTVLGGFLGTYADYEKNDWRIRDPLMEIPRKIPPFKDNFSPYITMWTRDLGFAQDPEGHGYGVFPP